MTAALIELRHREQRLRRRLVAPLGIAAAALGFCGVLAHVLGYWSIFGVTHDGTYLVGWFTIAIGFGAGAAPIAIPASVAYAVARSRMRARWCEEQAKKSGLDRELLARNAKRYG